MSVNDLEEKIDKISDKSSNDSKTQPSKQHNNSKNPGDSNPKNQINNKGDKGIKFTITSDKNDSTDNQKSITSIASNLSLEDDADSLSNKKLIKLLEDRIESLLNKLTPKEDPGQSVSYTSIDNSINIVNSTIDNFHVGTKRNDIIIGTDVAEIISGGIGRDKLTGGDGADGFLFGQEADFGKKKADLLKDFDPIEGDSILIEKDSFDLGKKVKFKS